MAEPERISTYQHLFLFSKEKLNANEKPGMGAKSATSVGGRSRFMTAMRKMVLYSHQRRADQCMGLP